MVSNIACSFAMYTDAPAGGLMACWFFYQAAEAVDPEAAVNAIWDHLFPPFSTPQHYEVKYYGMNIRDALAPFTDPDLFNLEVTVGLAGASTAAALPLELAVIIQRRADSVDRKKWGRIFWPGVSLDRLANSLHGLVVDKETGSAHAEIEAMRDAIISPVMVGGVELTPCIWSRKLETLLPVVEVHVAPLVGHLKRRRPYPYNFVPYE